MNRLETIKSMVSKCSIVADIGTDHGYVAEMLLSEGICNKVIATDLNKGPLNRATEYLTLKGLSEKCDFRLGNGLAVLKEGEADAIIIAGMGGDLITDIIDVSKNISRKSKQLILQPMTAVDKLRHYLYENNFKIIDENIVKEFHHYYFVIKAQPGYDKVEDEIFYEISKNLIDKKDEIVAEYIKKKINTNEDIIKNLENSKNPEYNEKINNLRIKNNKYMELIKYDSQ